MEDLFITLSLPDNQPFKWERNGGHDLHREDARSIGSPADRHAICHNAPSHLRHLLAWRMISELPTAQQEPELAGSSKGSRSLIGSVYSQVVFCCLSMLPRLPATADYRSLAATFTEEHEKNPRSSHFNFGAFFARQGWRP